MNKSYLKIGVVFVLLLGGLTYLCAQTIEPPDIMAAIDTAQMDAALAHIHELQNAAAPYQQTIENICVRYKIPPQDLGRGTNVDFRTGKITRPTAKP